MWLVVVRNACARLQLEMFRRAVRLQRCIVERTWIVFHYYISSHLNRSRDAIERERRLSVCSSRIIYFCVTTNIGRGANAKQSLVPSTADKEFNLISSTSVNITKATTTTTKRGNVFHCVASRKSNNSHLMLKMRPQIDEKKPYKLNWSNYVLWCLVAAICIVRH